MVRICTSLHVVNIHQSYVAHCLSEKNNDSKKNMATNFGLWLIIENWENILNNNNNNNNNNNKNILDILDIVKDKSIIKSERKLLNIHIEVCINNNNNNKNNNIFSVHFHNNNNNNNNNCSENILLHLNSSVSDIVKVENILNNYYNYKKLI